MCSAPRHCVPTDLDEDGYLQPDPDGGTMTGLLHDHVTAEARWDEPPLCAAISLGSTLHAWA